ncbi:helix-turn-helix domain-containing protein [Streptomyces sp. NPDC060366]|uniref:helix-turn-helix domain-containing protein n=1 Tax=Streptomyces sp. NPDC060366 TaxID=3347105 RepID=UPI0036534CEF
MGTETGPGTGPDPEAARTPAEFVRAMRQLRGWADLSYRQLERRASEAGDALPRATVSGVLAREDLPREELLTAFVRACGVDAATVDTWLEARRRLAMAMEEPAAPDWGGGEPRPDPEPHTAASAASTGTGTDPGTITSEEPPATQAAPPSPAEPASGGDPGVLAEDVVRESSATTPKRANSAPPRPKTAALRRVRRGGLAITVAVVIVVLTATATDFLRPRGGTADPKDSPTSGPSVTISPEKKASPSSAPETSKDTTPEPPEDKPVTGRTRDAVQPTSAEKTTRPKEPRPTPSSWTPPPPPYEPPPSYTPPPDDDGGGDPFPEETCWDVTNDCV